MRQKDAPGLPSFLMADYPGERGGFVGIGVLGKPDEQTDEYDFEQINGWFGEEVILTTGVAVDKEDTAGSKTKQRFKHGS